MENINILHNSTSWKELGIKDKIQYSMSVVLIIAAIALAFVSFLITLSIGAGVISAVALFLSSALAIYGISMYVKNSMADIQTQVNQTLKKISEKIEEKQNE